MSDETYNGWTNYPTWNVALWLGNEEGRYLAALELAAQKYEYDFERAEAFKDWVTDELAPDLGASFAADLLGYALGEVDWQEVADSFKDEE